MMTNKINNIVILFFTIYLGVSSHQIRKINIIADDNHNNFAKILKSLVKLNEDRLSTLKKLYKLNEQDHLKTTLRNREDEYDDIIKSITLILDGLKETDDVSHGVPEYFRTKHRYYTNKNRFGNKQKFFLRTLKDINRESVEASSPEDTDLKKKNGNGKDNDDKNLRYYYTYEYSCGLPHIRCKKACRKAIKKACYYWKDCSDKFKSYMKRACKTECSSQYDEYDSYWKAKRNTVL